jgi:hypothetical protein
MLRFWVGLRRWRNWAKAAGFIAVLTSAIVCSFLWAISNPPPPSGRPIAEHNHAAANTEQQTADPNQRGTKAVPLAVEIVSPKEGTPEAERNEEERQQKAANERGLVVGTWGLVLATGFLVIAASIQAALFVWQLLLLRDSLADTKKTADAALAAAEAAKLQATSIVSAERPYVFMEIKENGIKFNLNGTFEF